MVDGRFLRKCITWKIPINATDYSHAISEVLQDINEMLDPLEQMQLLENNFSPWDSVSDAFSPDI